VRKKADLKEENPMEIDLEERGRKIVDEYLHNIAEAINCLDRSKDIFERIADKNNWNDDITYAVESAEASLGVALAALVTWYDDEKESSKNDS